MATLSKFLIERLISAGIKKIPALPGDYVLEFYDLLSKSIEVVGCTNETNAGYAADAYARLNGIGCVCVTYGVGGFNLINPVACAYAEKSPLIVISGSPGLNERGDKVLIHHLANHFDLQFEMFKGITCASTVLNDMDTAGYEIDRVIRACKHYKQPVYIEIPRDMVDRSVRYDAFSRGTPVSPKSNPEILKECLEDVSEWLHKAKNPIIWVGIEVARHGLGQKLMDWAEINQIPIATTILGKGTINETHPCSLGVYCEGLSSDELKKKFAEAEVCISLGVMNSDVNSGFLPVKMKRKNTINATTEIIQISNHSYPEVTFTDFVEGLLRMEISGRPKLNLPKVSPAIPPESPSGTITNARFFHKLSCFVDEKSVIVCDVGDSLFGSLDLPVKETNHFLCDAFYTSMGFAVPAAVGVACANPENRPVVVVGDGAFQMTGQEFATLVKLKNPATVFVMNNGGYGTERLIKDGPYNDIPNWDYAKIAESYGGIGIKCQTESQLEEAMNVAKKSKDKPVLIDVCLAKNDVSSNLRRVFKNKYGKS